MSCSCKGTVNLRCLRSCVPLARTSGLLTAPPLLLGRVPYLVHLCLSSHLEQNPRSSNPRPARLSPLPAPPPALCPPSCFSGHWPSCSLFPGSPGLGLWSDAASQRRSPGWPASFSSSGPSGYRTHLFLPDGTAGFTQRGLRTLLSTAAPRVP